MATVPLLIPSFALLSLCQPAPLAQHQLWKPAAGRWGYVPGAPSWFEQKQGQEQVQER